MIGFNKRTSIAKHFMNLTRGNKTTRMGRSAKMFDCSIHTVRRIVNNECKWVMKEGKRTGFWLVSKKKTTFNM